ncbi:hypothetical protein Tco_1229599 [Tanacetum coccineum]
MAYNSSSSNANSKESDSEDDDIVVKPKEVTKIVKPSFEKIESINARNETVRQVENLRKNNKSPRGNKRNWNGMITHKLGDNFEYKNKTCYVCGSIDHLHYTCKHKRHLNNQKQVKPVWNNSKRVNHQNFGRFSHPNQKSNIVPQAVLTKSSLVSLNTAKSVSTAQSRKTMNDAMPTTYSYYKAYSFVKRPFNKKIANYNRYFNKRVNIVKSTRVNTARPKAEVNTVKASASWVWEPKHEELDHVFKSNSASKTLTRYDYVDALEKLKLLCVTRVNFGLLNCHSEVDVWIPLKLLLLKIVLEGVSNKQQVIRVWRSGYNRNIWQLVKKYDFNAASLIAVNTARFGFISTATLSLYLPKFKSKLGVYESARTIKCCQETLILPVHVSAAITKEFKNHLSDNEESLGEDASKQGRIDDADAEVTFIDETLNDARNKNNKISNNN